MSILKSLITDRRISKSLSEQIKFHLIPREPSRKMICSSSNLWELAFQMGCNCTLQETKDQNKMQCHFKPLSMAASLLLKQPLTAIGEAGLQDWSGHAELRAS